jgi:hypothetical protein
MSAIEDHWYEVGYKEGMSDAGAEITRLRAEVERLTARLNFSKNDFEITKLQAALSRGDEMAARAESAERKLAMAVEPLRAARKAILMLSPNPDGVLGMQALAAVKSIDATLAELEKADG